MFCLNWELYELAVSFATHLAIYLDFLISCSIGTEHTMQHPTQVAVGDVKPPSLATLVPLYSFKTKTVKKDNFADLDHN